MKGNELNYILTGVLFLIIGLVSFASYKRMAQQLYEFYEIRRALGLTKRVYEASCFVSAILACIAGLIFMIIGLMEGTFLRK
jgi:hypothetical protein